MNDTPLITIYMPTHNRSSLIGRAIDSVIKQTYQNWELVIVDDCSIDDTENVIKEYIKKDPRIKYIKNETNMGACFSRNRAINTAQGDFITGLDDDDYFLPNRLEVFLKQWYLLPKDKIFIFSQYYFLQGDDLIDGGIGRKLKNNRRLKQKDMLIKNFVGTQIFARLCEIKKTDLFDVNLPMWQDYEFFYRLLSLGFGYSVHEKTYVIDQNHDMGRISDNKGKKLLYTYEYFLKKHNLNSLERVLLKNFLFYYDDKYIKIKPLIVSMLIYPSQQPIKHFLRRLKFFVNTLR